MGIIACGREVVGWAGRQMVQIDVLVERSIGLSPARMTDLSRIGLCPPFLCGRSLMLHVLATRVVPNVQLCLSVGDGGSCTCKAAGQDGFVTTEAQRTVYLEGEKMKDDERDSMVRQYIGFKGRSECLRQTLQLLHLCGGELVHRSTNFALFQPQAIVELGLAQR